MAEIADRIEIEQLLVRYTHAIDDRDWDRLDTVFTPDARLDYRSSGGPDAAGDYRTMKAWLQHNLGLFGTTQHLVGKSAMEVAGDIAHCRTVFHNPMGVPVDEDGFHDPTGTAVHIMVIGGTYLDTCVRTPAGWRIAEKVQQTDIVQGGFPPGR